MAEGLVIHVAFGGGLQVGDRSLNCEHDGFESRASVRRLKRSLVSIGPAFDAADLRAHISVSSFKMTHTEAGTHFNLSLNAVLWELVRLRTPVIREISKSLPLTRQVFKKLVSWSWFQPSSSSAEQGSPSDGMSLTIQGYERARCNSFDQVCTY